jgi:kumamolisin
VPDVAGDADPATGYVIRVDGKTMVIGGTSAVAPLYAGLLALANQQNGKPAGFINPVIYSSKGNKAFRDIVTGNNGNFPAGSGWDACTGLGSPIAPQFITAVKPATTASKSVKIKTASKPARKSSHRKTAARRR